MQSNHLPWELEEEVLSHLPPKPLARFRSVCKRWNALFNDLRFINIHLPRARPQFILLSDAKICSVDVNLDNIPSIKVHNLPYDFPGYLKRLVTRIEYCEGLLIYATCRGFGICNPWLQHIRWIKSSPSYCRYNGMGYDNNKPDIPYKIFGSDINDPTTKANITELGSNAWKSYEFTTDDWTLATSYYSVSLNGTLYWNAFHRKSRKHFIQSFDFSMESFKPYCVLPGKTNTYTIKALEIFKGDRFSILEQDYNTRNMEIWVTKKKIQNGDGEAVEWMKFMNVLVPEWSSLVVDLPPSYFIDEKTHSLVLCCTNEEDNTCIYVATGDKFHEIKINELVGYHTRQRTYFPSLVPVPSDKVGSRFAYPWGVEASNGVGENEWDDGFFDNVKKISVGTNHFGVVFVKFDYSNGNTIVVGATHGNATNILNGDILIDKDDFIEGVEGTYSDNHITSLAFRLHKTKMSRQYGIHKNTPFVIRGRGSKIIGFYGRNSDDHLTAIGVHLNTSI